MKNNVVNVVKSWLKMYDFQWGRQADPDVQRVWARLFVDADPDRLNEAFQEAFKQSEYYPTPDLVRGWLKPARREGLVWIRPTDGECHGEDYNHLRMVDGRAQRCACRDCRPDLPWCRWQYSAGTWCRRYTGTKSKPAGQPYCGHHHAAAAEHFEIFSLDLADQIAYFKDLDRQGLLVFQSEEPSPAIAGQTYPACHSWRELREVIGKMVGEKGFTKPVPAGGSE